MKDVIAGFGQISGFLLFISIFYLVGFAVLGYGLWNGFRSAQAANWPTTPARITDLRVEESTDDDGTTHKVIVQYAYTVKEIDYVSSRLAFGYGGSSNCGAHQEIHERLKTANIVEARYNPANPAISCLSCGLHHSIQSTVLFALVWLTFVFGFTLLICLNSGSDEVLLNNLIVR